ncbi:MAG TPA: hypothetical protein VHF22_03645 [Planctomycetota bacterium]|nr:hypothetical protein [Planctomycetota bacterium]
MERIERAFLVVAGLIVLGVAAVGPRIEEVRRDPRGPALDRAPAPRAIPGDPAAAAEAVVLPPEVREKYRHFEDVVDVARSGSGAPVTLDDGAAAWRIDDLAETSPLRTVLGLAAGDVLVSLNGLSLERERARAIYDALRSERRFELVILRDGARRTIAFELE